MKLSEGKHARIERHQIRPAAENLHPAWVAFIRHCRDLGFGEVSQLKIQDGLPVMAEETIKKVKFI